MVQNWDMPSMMWLGTGFTWVFTLLFVIFLLLGIVALAKWIQAPTFEDKFHHKSALEILKERYAKGEIDRKEYEEKKKDLS